MKIDLDKKDLISLVKGTPPNYSAMDDYRVKCRGSFSGSYGRWDWNHNAFEDCTEEKILEIYQLCKNSWND